MYHPQRTLALPPGTRLGVYEVTAQIREGGMGQAYRAADTKLKRQVAIKILPPSLAADTDCLARFQREAEVSLSQRIARGAIPIDEALLWRGAGSENGEAGTRRVREADGIIR